MEGEFFSLCTCSTPSTSHRPMYPDSRHYSSSTNTKIRVRALIRTAVQTAGISSGWETRINPCNALWKMLMDVQKSMQPFPHGLAFVFVDVVHANITVKRLKGKYKWRQASRPDQIWIPLFPLHYVSIFDYAIMFLTFQMLMRYRHTSLRTHWWPTFF